MARRAKPVKFFSTQKKTIRSGKKKSMWLSQWLIYTMCLRRILKIHEELLSSLQYKFLKMQMYSLEQIFIKQYAPLIMLDADTDRKTNKKQREFPVQWERLILCTELGLEQVFPWRRKWQLTPVFLPGESHGQSSLVGYGPWGRKESDTTDWLHSAYNSKQSR